MRPSAQIRGEDTRQRLVLAALEVFGHYGFEGTSTRQLAERAGVNLAAIPYHFGGKEGLYAAVAKHIAARVGEALGPMVEMLQARLAKGELDRPAALGCLKELLDRFALTLIANPEAESWARFVIREQMEPTAAFEVLYNGVMRRVHGTLCALLAVVTDRPAEDEATKLLAFTLVGQLMVFRVARAAVLRRMGWNGFTAEHIAAIRSLVHANVDAILAR